MVHYVHFCKRHYTLKTRNDFIKGENTTPQKCLFPALVAAWRKRAGLYGGRLGTASLKGL